MAYEIRNQKLPFMFEYWPPGATAPSKRFILPVNPESYRIQHNARVSVVQTKGGTFTDNFGMGVAKISMQGTFGLLGSLPGGPGQHAEGLRKDAWSLLKEAEIEVFFEFYKQFGSDANPDQAQKAQLRFYNFTDEQAFEVILHPFSVTRSTQRRFLYQYTMEMQVIRDLLSTPYDIATDAPTLALKDVPAPDSEMFKTWKKILAGYTSLSNKVSDAINLMTEVESKIDTIATAVNGFRNGMSSFITVGFDVVESAIHSVDTIIDAVITVEDLPHEFTDHLRELKRRLYHGRINKHLFKQSNDSQIPASSSTTQAVEIITAQAPPNAVEVPISTGENPETTIFSAGIEQAENVVTSATTVTESDTIETIASRTLGDATQWRRIAFLNNLEPPFVAKGWEDAFSETLATGTLVAILGRTLEISGFVPTPGQVIVIHSGGGYEPLVVESYAAPQMVTCEKTIVESHPVGSTVTLHESTMNVVRPGDTIKIPGTANRDTPPTLGDYQNHYDAIYGADEYLNQNGEHEDDRTGDVAIVVGLKNLEMQLSHRLKTMRGELATVGHPNYGSLIPSFIGKVDTDYWLERIRMEARAVVLEDPRIKSVDSLNVRVDGDAVYIDAKATTAGVDGSRKLSLLL